VTARGLLEPDAGKLARPVLRGLRRGNAPELPDQAVAKLNKTGQWSGDLVPYAQESDRRAARLEAAGEDLRKRFLRAIRAPGPRGPQSPDHPAVPG
jgi:hypothetical protein